MLQKETLKARGAAQSSALKHFAPCLKRQYLILANV